MQRKKIKKERRLRFRKELLYALRHSLVVTGLVFMLMWTLVYDPLSSLSFLAPTENNIDFRMSDIYNAISESSERKKADEQIVIVGIDDCVDRRQIADALTDILECSPAAVGLDVMFFNPMEPVADSELLTAMNLSDNIVTAMIVRDYDSYSDEFMSSVHSFFVPYSPVLREGYINLRGKDGRSMIRDFTPRVSVAGDTVYSFPVELLRMVSPESFQRLRQRGMETEQIDFKQTAFLTLDRGDVVSNKESLRDKIVLVGNIYDLDDVHNTPVSISMNGLYIHAYTLSTMLDGKYIEPMGSSSDVLWAVLLCFLLSFIGVVLKRRLPGGSDLFLRVAQFVFMYGCLVAGYVMFVRDNAYLGFTKTLMALGFTALILDLWLGMVWAAPKVWSFGKKCCSVLSRWIKASFKKIAGIIKTIYHWSVTVCKKK